MNVRLKGNKILREEFKTSETVAKFNELSETDKKHAVNELNSGLMLLDIFTGFYRSPRGIDELYKAINKMGDVFAKYELRKTFIHKGDI